MVTNSHPVRPKAHESPNTLTRHTLFENSSQPEVSVVRSIVVSRFVYRFDDVVCCTARNVRNRRFLHSCIEIGCGLTGQFAVLYLCRKLAECRTVGRILGRLELGGGTDIPMLARLRHGFGVFSWL